MVDNLSMSKCPICECSATELGDLLESIDNLVVLRTLACDMAERVADLTPDPAQSKVWIAAARLGQLTQVQVEEVSSVWEKAGNAWWEAKEASGVHHPLEQLESASRAMAWIAPDARNTDGRGELGDARDSVWEAAAAEEATAIDLEAERAWQMSRAREAACTCVQLQKEQEKYEHRSRVSLLAG